MSWKIGPLDRSESASWTREWRIKMGGVVKSGNLTHDNACNLAEGVRQASVAGNPTQTAVNNAEITWARACVASCNANNGGVGAEPVRRLLLSMGTGGSWWLPASDRW